MKSTKTPKQIKKEKRQKNRGTIPVWAVCDCGCCYAEMRFFSKKTAEDALKNVGLGNSVAITDDKGVVHEGLDTFYGFSLTDPRKR